jgi:ADP-ribosylglycohydrolase
MNNHLPNDHDARIARARVALDGLSVGDAFGGMFFSAGAELMVRERLLFAAPWDWTDDTQMALSVYEECQRGGVEQDRLARNFADRYDPRRGYGPSMNGQLQQVREGTPWEVAARLPFDGQGSYGNGAAMRIAPLGAYFADDLGAVVAQAVLASEVTHAHPEGIAGGVAAAVATAVAARYAGSPAPSRADFVDAVLPYVPEGDVRTRCVRARDLPADASVTFAAVRLGNGVRVSAQDTVPFCLFCAGEFLSDYRETLWNTVGAMGDRDTTCAIVGGIVAAYVGAAGVPGEWLEAREPLV